MESEKYPYFTIVVPAGYGLPEDVIIAVQPLVDVAEPISAQNQALAEKPTSPKENPMENHLRGPTQYLASRLSQEKCGALSIEEQQYYNKIISAISGSDNVICNAALSSLATDVFFSGVLPHFCTFIADSVQIHIVHMNFQILINIMHMVKALIDNKSLSLDAFLHQLLPSVLSCCVTRQLSLQQSDDHWALRDFAANLIAIFYKNYNSAMMNLQARVKNVYCKSFKHINNIPLSSLYGSIAGLSRLGDDVIIDIILPHVKLISSRIENHLTENNGVDVDRICTTLQKYCAPILKKIRNKSDGFDEYINDYGCIGHLLYNEVQGFTARPHNVAATPKHDIIIKKKPKPNEQEQKQLDVKLTTLGSTLQKLKLQSVPR